MSGTITNVVKGRMLGNADARLRLREEDGETLDAYVARMKKLLEWYTENTSGRWQHVDHAASVTDVGKDHRVAMDEQQIIHARDEFFGDGDKAYFPDIPGDKEDAVVRAGYITAIRLALEAAKAGDKERLKPIVSWWIITDLPSDEIEMYIDESEREIHVMIMTPRPVKHFSVPENGSLLENMFLVATHERIAQIVEKYPKIRADYRSPVADSTPGIESLRIVGY